LIRKIHIVKVNCPGGIVSAGDLLSIAKAALAAGLQGLRFGGRQQLLMEVYSDKLAPLTAALHDAALPFEVDADIYPNIMSACVAEQMVYTSSWLREGVYKDVLDSFDYRTRLAVNLVDQGQSFVPLNTGQLNFIASGMGNYWHLLLRVSPEGRLQEWKSLVYSGNIPRLTRRLEGFLLDGEKSSAESGTDPQDEAARVRRMYDDILHSEQWMEQPPQEQISYPDFALPYYEGFNRYLDRLWLGIYRRDELFTPAFLVNLCTLCLQTKVAQLYTTPWKSLVIQGIAPGDRKRWDIILGRHGINVRHSLCELSWQVEDISDEGLSLKHYLVRQFDRDDIRTFGLCFAIQMQHGACLFGLVQIRRQPSRKSTQLKALDRYDILYRKDFDACSDEYILFRKDVEKDQLGTYLKSLCKYFYECKSGEDMILHHVYREKEDSSAASSGTSITGTPSPGSVYQCIHCLTVYDPALGDPEAEIPAGTVFSTLAHYACPVCGSDNWTQQASN
jgi:rubredoxin